MARVDPLHPARLIVVGGHTRGVGKTSAIEHILRTRRGEPWTAVKISAHRHARPDGSTPLVEEATEVSPHTQTGRYLEAGASRALLCRTPDTRLAETAALLQRLLAGGHRVIVESNRIVSLVHADVVLFLVAPALDDWKPSSGLCLTRADALVSTGRPALVAAALAGQGAGVDDRPVFCMDSDRRVHGLDVWLDARMARARGTAQGRAAMHVGARPAASAVPG